MRFNLAIVLVALVTLAACGGGGYHDEHYDGCGCEPPPPPPCYQCDPCYDCEPPLPPPPLPEVAIDVCIELGLDAPCDFLGWVVCSSHNTPSDYDPDADYLCEIGLDWEGDPGGTHDRGDTTCFEAYAFDTDDVWVEIYGLGTNGIGYYLGLFEVVGGAVSASFNQGQDVVGFIDTATGQASPDWLSMPYHDALLADLFDQQAWEVMAGL